MSTLTENVEKVKSAHDALSASIEAKGVSVPAGTKLTGMPALVDQIQTGGGFTEDTTTLSVAFGGLARKITPKDVISFSSLTWQGERHELGSKDYGVFDGNFQLDEAFWPAKPLPGYVYVQFDGMDNTDTNNRFYMQIEDNQNNVIKRFDIINNIAYKLPDNANYVSIKNDNIENYSNQNYIITRIVYNCISSYFDIVDITKYTTGSIVSDKEKMAYSFLIRCSTSQKSMLFLDCGNNEIGMDVDGRVINPNPSTCFIPIDSTFSVYTDGIYVQYVDSYSHFNKTNLQTYTQYSLQDFDNPNILYLGYSN